MAEPQDPPAGPAAARVRPAVVTLRGIRKAYNAGTPIETEVLHGIDLDLAQGEFCAVMGPSGSGKSTLLNIIGLLDRPSSGTVTVCGEQTGALDTMLNKIADFYEDEVDVAVAALTSLIEPIMMVFIGGSVGTMIIAMYLPIFTMAGNVKAE